MKKVPGAFFQPFDDLEKTPEEKRMEEKHNAANEAKAARNPYNAEGFYTPERRIPQAPKVSEYITISVAEYHFLTKAATLLEAILNADAYSPKPVVDAARKSVEEMKRTAEAGADQ